MMLIPSGETDTPPSSMPSSLEYCEMLETETAELLCGISGIKSCRVIITLESGFEYTYASDKYSSQKYGSDGKTENIEAKSEIFANGDGDAVLIKEKMPRVAGVAVVCQNADAETKLKIISLLSALFDIGSDRISVQT